jgi:hypothetical protein
MHLKLSNQHNAIHTYIFFVRFFKLKQLRKDKTARDSYTEIFSKINLSKIVVKQTKNRAPTIPTILTEKAMN